MDLISVIVPVYKVEPYLDACVQSIVNQTYRNLEIILVDDGSPDSCPALCDAWAAKDSRIRVIHKENGGQGEARNYGIAAANGVYIGFADSDDVIAPQMYEQLHRALTAKNAAFVQCRMASYTDALPAFSASDAPGLRVFDREAAVSGLLRDEITSTCPTILLRAAIAKAVPFDCGMINEDVMWVYRVLRASEKIVLLDAVLYAYRQHAGSTMHLEYSERKFDAFKAARMRADAIRTDFPALYPRAERSYAGLCMYHYQCLCRLPDSEQHRAFRNRLYSMFCSADLRAVYAVTSLKYRIWYTMFQKMPVLTCRIRNFLKIGL